VAVAPQPVKVTPTPEPAAVAPAPEKDAAPVTETKVEPVKVETKTSTESKTDRKQRNARRDTTPTPNPAPPPAKRVATGADPEAAKSKADALYRQKKFTEASSVLSSAAKAVGDDSEARQLRRTSDMYTKLGRALAAGTAPATKSTEAFEALRQAANYDGNVGNAFDGEINSKLAQVAPKAALSYMAAKNYSAARSAVLVAQQFGASKSVELVSSKLESGAGDLYNEAMRELDSNPSGAKEKFRQIKSIVDAKSSWYQKAQKQLQGG
jgi:hypothetical protein